MANVAGLTGVLGAPTDAVLVGTVHVGSTNSTVDVTRAPAVADVATTVAGFVGIGNMVGTDSTVVVA